MPAPQNNSPYGVPVVSAYTGPAGPPVPGWAAPALQPPVRGPRTLRWATIALALVVVMIVVVGLNRNEPHRSLSAPAEAAGLRRLDDPNFDQMRSLLAVWELGQLSDPIAELYAAPGESAPTAMVLAAHADDVDPGDVLAGMPLGGVQSGFDFEFTDYPAGRLGGTFRCGTSADRSRAEATVCTWVDDYTVGVVFVYSTTPEAVPLAVALREAVER